MVPNTSHARPSSLAAKEIKIPNYTPEYQPPIHTSIKIHRQQYYFSVVQGEMNDQNANASLYSIATINRAGGIMYKSKSNTSAKPNQTLYQTSFMLIYNTVLLPALILIFDEIFGPLRGWTRHTGRPRFRTFPPHLLNTTITHRARRTLSLAYIAFLQIAGFDCWWCRSGCSSYTCLFAFRFLLFQFLCCFRCLSCLNLFLLIFQLPRCRRKFESTRFSDQWVFIHVFISPSHS